MSLNRKLVCAGLAALTSFPFASPAPAQAATAPATMAVTATVLSFCTISAVPLAFGNYTSAALAATANLTVSCTLGTPYNVSLDVGVGAGATIGTRKMTFGANTLNYGLFSDSAHMVPWGVTVGTNTIAGTATGLPQLLPVYGLIPAGQLVGPGAYTDTITATVVY